LSDPSSEDKPLLEEHAVPERRGLFGGKKLETNGGKLERTTFLMTCDYCGKYPLDHFLLCRARGEKLCSDCAVKVDGRPYCITHLAEIFWLSRTGYMTLSCVNSNVQSVSKIAEICRLKKDDVRTSLAVLAESKYIVTSGVLSFLSRKITADGIRILSIYSKVFGKDEDVVDMMKRLEVETEEDNDGA
jgi:hypothetical protein